jgi:hypothetical protein
MIMRHLALCIVACACNFRALSFTCAADAQCGVSGRCIDGGCAFPSQGCDGGLAWDSTAGRTGCVTTPDLSDFAVAISHDLAGVIPLANGDACSSGKACDSGNCIDGVCCDAPCIGLCLTCGGGHCRPAPSGTNPRGDCMPDGTRCGLDGTCDGSGACRKKPAASICQTQSCVGGTLTRAATCDGNGACVPPSTRSCAPYTCLPDGSDCASSCGADLGACAPPASCSGGSCGLSPDGASCTSASGCLSGHCADGVCCNSDCTVACVACNLAGKEGTCSNVPSGASDLHGTCSDQGAATCGQTGKCNGAGGCALYAAGTVCAPPVCSGDHKTWFDTAKCTGLGSGCPAGTSYGCSPYVCVDALDTRPAYCTDNCGCCLCLPGMSPPFPNSCLSGFSCVNRCSDLSKWACQ